VVRCTFSPARAWRPAVVAPLARTLGVTTQPAAAQSATVIWNMLRTLFKFTLAAITLFLIYKAASIYSLFQFADHLRVCLPPSGVCGLAEANAPRQKLEGAMVEALSCVRKRQTLIEATFLRIPDHENTSSPSSTDGNAMLEMCRDLVGPGRKP